MARRRPTSRRRNPGASFSSIKPMPAWVADELARGARALWEAQHALSRVLMGWRSAPNPDTHHIVRTRGFVHSARKTLARLGDRFA